MLDDLDHTLRVKCLRLICRICGDRGLLPKSLAIPLSLDRMEDPLWCNRLVRISKGTFCGLDVAVKVLQVHIDNDLEQVIKVGD